MPRASIGVGLIPEHFSQDSMGDLALACRSALVDGGPHKRMAELKLSLLHSEETDTLGRVEVLCDDPQELRRLKHCCPPARIVDRADEQDRLRLCRKLSDPLKKGAFKALAGWERHGQGVVPQELLCAQDVWKLEEGEGVSFGSLDEASGHVRCDFDPSPRAQQLCRRLAVESSDIELRDAGSVEGPNITLARGKQQHDPFRLQSSSDEDQRARGRLVQPVGIVDQADERGLFRGLRKQSEDGDRDQEALIAAAPLHAEGRSQGTLLRWRESLELWKHRPENLVQSGEGKLRLRLYAAASEQLRLRCAPGRVLEQGGFADSRLASKHENAAA